MQAALGYRPQSSSVAFRRASQAAARRAEARLVGVRGMRCLPLALTSPRAAECAVGAVDGGGLARQRPQRARLQRAMRETATRGGLLL